MNTKRFIENSFIIFILMALLLIGISACQSIKARTVAAKNSETGNEIEYEESNSIDPLISNEDEDLESDPPEPTPPLSDEDAILAMLADHFQMEESDFYHFEIKENTGMHARGGVDNGYFLAAKVNGEWIFVDGGHSWPNCNDVASYGFPGSMVPECPSAGANMPDCPGVGRIEATFIKDVNYPDGSILEPGQIFLKTWRIKNVGTCTWNADYDLVFFGGDQMGGPNSQILTDIHVAPGESKDISVWLTAPEMPGTYRGNWKLRDPRGEIFGLTTGNPFWVEIKVKPESSDWGNESAAYSGYPTIDILDVSQNRTVTIKGENFPAHDQFNVVMNYYGTLGVNGTYVTSIKTGDGGEFIDTYQIPAFLEGQSYIAIRLESPQSGYYTYNWFYNF